MSKQSKLLEKTHYFDFQFTKKSKTRLVMPKSAQKGKSYTQQLDHLNKQQEKQIKHSLNPFSLKYRNKRQKNQFVNFYRLKSLNSSIRFVQAQDLRSITILGTFDKKIIIGFNQKLKIFCFIDQHAMHQRIRYEYYLQCLKNYDNQNQQNPKSKTPWILQVIQKTGKQPQVISKIHNSYISYKMTSQFDQQIEKSKKISKYGFEIQYIKQSRTLKIHKFPQILQRSLQMKLILNICHDIMLERANLPKSFESIIAQMSCKSAFKFNDQLDTQVINKLLYNLSLCQYPFFCVHGRPTLFTKI